MKDPRVVCFNHAILSGIRHGIQASHAQVKLVRKYRNKTIKYSKELAFWADKSPTTVVLDGGMTPELDTIRKKIPPGFLWAQFREPDYGNMVTSIVVFIPDKDWTGETQKERNFNRMMFQRKLAK